jgi:hypothetical protein
MTDFNVLKVYTVHYYYTRQILLFFTALNVRYFELKFDTLIEPNIAYI